MCMPARLRLRIASDGFPHSFLQVPKGVCVHENAEYQVSSELGGDGGGGRVALPLPEDGVMHV